MQLWETGLLDKFVNDYFNVPNAEKCFSKKKSSAKDVPIKLVDLTGAFLILGIGLGAGILCFLIELIVAKFRREMKLTREMTHQLEPEEKSKPPSSSSSVEVPIEVAATDDGQPRQSTIEKEEVVMELAGEIKNAVENGKSKTEEKPADNGQTQSSALEELEIVAELPSNVKNVGNQPGNEKPNPEGAMLPDTKTNQLSVSSNEEKADQVTLMAGLINELDNLLLENSSQQSEPSVNNEKPKPEAAENN